MLSRFLRPVLLLVASVSFGLGISLPLMQVDKLWLFSETPSILEIIADLWTNGETLLAVVVVTFSIIFPLLKMWTAFQAVYMSRHSNGWVSALAKWSMLDVLLVAIVIFAAKTSGLADAVTRPGLWFFAVSAITIAAATTGLRKA